MPAGGADDAHPRMRLRSLLFVPGDSERKFARAQTAGADVLILDLEDAVAPSRKPQARAHVASLVAAEKDWGWRFFVRVNPLESGLLLHDLVAVVRPGLHGILVPKSGGADDVARIGHYLDALELRAGMAPGEVAIAVVATETPAAMFRLGSYAPAHPRLAALTWGAEDLAAAIGATDKKERDGSWTFPYQLARAHCLFAAAAAGVAPIDTLYADFRHTSGLEASCHTARRDGFVGRIAIHPDQVATINACFTPSDTELAQAKRVIEAFAAEPEAGTIGIDGRMYDIPHLKAAHRTFNARQE